MPIPLGCEHPPRSLCVHDRSGFGFMHGVIPCDRGAFDSVECVVDASLSSIVDVLGEVVQAQAEIVTIIPQASMLEFDELIVYVCSIVPRFLTYAMVTPTELESLWSRLFPLGGAEVFGKVREDRGCGTAKVKEGQRGRIIRGTNGQGTNVLEADGERAHGTREFPVARAVGHSAGMQWGGRLGHCRSSGCESRDATDVLHFTFGSRERPQPGSEHKYLFRVEIESDPYPYVHTFLIQFYTDQCSRRGADYSTPSKVWFTCIYTLYIFIYVYHTSHTCVFVCQHAFCTGESTIPIDTRF